MIMDYNFPDTFKKPTKPLTTGKELAQILGVSAPTLSEAAKKGYHCAGYPVIEWAEFSNSGRVEGYHVPEFLLAKKEEPIKNRPNPKPNTLNKVDKGADEAENVEKSQESVVTNNYSLIPAGENYTSPVGMASLSMVLKHALGNDTPQSRAVIGGALALLGAITAHGITDSGVAAGVGAGAGLGIALYFFNNYKKEEINPMDQTSQFIADPQYVAKPWVSSPVNSGFLVQ